MITEEESIPLLEEIFNISEKNHIEVTYFEVYIMYHIILVFIPIIIAIFQIKEYRLCCNRSWFRW